MDKPPAITLDTSVKPAADVLFRDLDGEAVLLSVGHARYYGLNESATRMWHCLVEHRQIARAWEALCAEYAAPADRLRAELLALVADLVRHGLLECDER